MYSVAATAKLTGLTPETLRAWERRHSWVVPLRDERGRRLYDTAMIDRLALLQRLTGRGHPIRHVAALDSGALQDLLEEAAHTGYGAVDGLAEQMMQAVVDYRIDVLDRQLAIAIATLPAAMLVGQVVAPLLYEVGARWAEGRLSIAQERLLSSLLRVRLLSVINSHPRERPPRLLFATLPGERHEHGLLIAALLASTAGAPLLYLGTELPGPELARAANQLRVRAVGLSCVDAGLSEEALPQIVDLERRLAPGIEVWLGGAQAESLVRTLGMPRIRRTTDPAIIERLARQA